MRVAKTRNGILAFVSALALMGFGLLSGVTPGFAQDGTPEAVVEGRPAHIHTGSCGEEELGDVIEALTNLTAPEGEAEGNTNAVAAESSFTSVPLALADILAEDHAVNVHLSTEEIGTYIACGEVGGVAGEDGSLVIGLKEQSDSGFTGVAFLMPGADGASTDVSVFIAEGLIGDMASMDMDDDEEATPEA